MSVAQYFRQIKGVALKDEEKLLVVAEKEKQMFFPVSLCKKTLPLERGLKDQKLRIKHMKTMFNDVFLPSCKDLRFEKVHFDAHQVAEEKPFEKPASEFVK